MANEKRLTIDTDKTCGDCIHAEICKKVNGSWFHPKNIAYCTAFKERKDCVEVVRCKDCKHWNCWRNSEEGSGDCNLDEGYQTLATQHYDFCSYGERREGDV